VKKLDLIGLRVESFATAARSAPDAQMAIITVPYCYDSYDGTCWMSCRGCETTIDCP
jgi:hypothetical protein